MISSGLGGGYGSQLHALDLATGRHVWGPIDLPGTYFSSWHAYDNGKIFVVNYDGLLKSFDAVTGTAGWSTKLPVQYSFDSAPSAVNGIVYLGGAGSGGTVYVVDEANGNVLWSAGVWTGPGSPAVSNDGVFVSVSCHVHKFHPLTGAEMWHFYNSCASGGAPTVVYGNGEWYVRESYTGGGSNIGAIFDSTSGNIASSFMSPSATPVIASSAGYYLNNGTLQGVDLASSHVQWSFAGDGGLYSPPLLIDQTVFVGSSSGKVYAVNAISGLQVWSGNVVSTSIGQTLMPGKGIWWYLQAISWRHGITRGLSQLFIDSRSTSIQQEDSNFVLRALPRPQHKWYEQQSVPLCSQSEIQIHCKGALPITSIRP